MEQNVSPFALSSAKMLMQQLFEARKAEFRNYAYYAVSHKAKVRRQQGKQVLSHKPSTNKFLGGNN